MEDIYMHEYKGSKQGNGASLDYHLKTAWLITKSDLKTTVLPATAFALASALSGPLLTTDLAPSITTIFSRLPSAILWTWMNLWLFNLANQRLPNSIIEDEINKPWRAIPSGRLTPTQARRLLLISIPIVYLMSIYFGARNETIVLMVLTWIYNDLGAADENFIFRHFNNALGFTAFGAGATQVICGAPLHTLNGTAYQWLAVIAAVITCTIQFQDMEDQEGDAMRDRRTLPLILGDEKTRYLNVLVIIAFSIIAPAFWQLGIYGYLIPVTQGVIIAVRSVKFRTLSADKATFQLWCLWLVTLYLLPLIRNSTVFAGLLPALS